MQKSSFDEKNKTEKSSFDEKNKTEKSSFDEKNKTEKSSFDTKNNTTTKDKNEKKHKKEENKRNKFVQEMLLITLGSFILAVGIGVFFEPLEIVVGGVSGLGIVLKEVSQRYFNFKIELWATNILFNVPLFLLAIKYKGLKFLAKTIYATMLLSLFLYVVSFFPVIETDLFLSAVYGGAIEGIGLGLVLRGMATTGGTDLAAFLIHKLVPHVSVSRLILYLDSTIIILGLFVFGYEKAMYAIIAVFLMTKCIEAVLEGLNFSKAVFIISDNAEKIADEISTLISRGSTGIFGKGMYTGKDKTVLLTVVSVKEIVILKQIVNNIDENSFVIVADVREVLGEGFKSIT